MSSRASECKFCFKEKKASPERFYFICSDCVTVVASFQNEFDFFFNKLERLRNEEWQFNVACVQGI